MVLKLRKVIPLEDKAVTERGHKGCCWILVLFCFFMWIMVSYMNTVSKNSLSCSFMACMLFSVYLSVQFSHSIMSSSWRPHGLQHARPPCSLPTSRVYSNSCPLSRWCLPITSSFVVPFSCCLQSFPASVFSNKLVLCIRLPKYWSFSFSISPSN